MSKIPWLPERLPEPKSIAEFMETSHPDYNQGIDACAVAYESWLKEQKPVGWCVFDENGNTESNDFFETPDLAIQSFRQDVHWMNVQSWTEWQAQGYTVEPVYREVKK